MTPRTAYKFMERFTFTGAIICTIVCMALSEKLFFCYPFLLIPLGIAILAICTNYTEEYKELMNLTNKQKKEMGDNYKKSVKRERKRFLFGFILLIALDLMVFWGPALIFLLDYFK